MKGLVISPHLDDAVFSVGQWLTLYPDSTVVTVFAGIPGSHRATPYDKKMGFANSREAQTERIQENANACLMLGVRAINLDFYDGQYEIPAQFGDVVKDLMETFYNLGPFSFVAGPLGLFHPDHKLVGQALHAMRSQIPVSIPVYAYADLPSAHLYPDLMAKAASQLHREPLQGVTGDRKQKAAACAMYVSQWDKHDIRPATVLVPERLWRLP